MDRKVQNEFGNSMLTQQTGLKPTDEMKETSVDYPFSKMSVACYVKKTAMTCNRKKKH